MLSIYRKTMGFHSSDRYEREGGSSLSDTGGDPSKNEKEKETEDDGEEENAVHELPAADLLTKSALFVGNLYYVVYAFSVSGADCVTIQIFAGALSGFFADIIGCLTPNHHVLNLFPGYVNLVLGCVSIWLSHSQADVGLIDKCCAYLTVLCGFSGLLHGYCHPNDYPDAGDYTDLGFNAIQLLVLI